jgi:hypothetical protein
MIFKKRFKKESKWLLSLKKILEIKKEKENRKQDI